MVSVRAWWGETQGIRGDMLKQNVKQDLRNLFFFPSLETMRKVEEIHRILENPTLNL